LILTLIMERETQGSSYKDGSTYYRRERPKVELQGEDSGDLP